MTDPKVAAVAMIDDLDHLISSQPVGDRPELLKRARGAMKLLEAQLVSGNARCKLDELRSSVGLRFGSDTAREGYRHEQIETYCRNDLGVLRDIVRKGR